MAEQICPACGCAVVQDYEKEEITYYCQPCAEGQQCECGCCEEVEEEE